MQDRHLHTHAHAHIHLRTLHTKTKTKATVVANINQKKKSKPKSKPKQTKLIKQQKGQKESVCVKREIKNDKKTETEKKKFNQSQQENRKS